jgi:hypothetical protein
MKRKFTIRAAEWPSKDREWELVFTTIDDEHSSHASVERVSLDYMAYMYAAIGEFLSSEVAGRTPSLPPYKNRKAQNV